MTQNTESTLDLIAYVEFQRTFRYALFPYMLAIRLYNLCLGCGRGWGLCVASPGAHNCNDQLL